MSNLQQPNLQYSKQGVELQKVFTKTEHLNIEVII